MASLNPRQIEAFRMVMLRGSVTGAASVLKVSQPAVSRLVRDLEVRTGLTLFERHGNHLLPTPEASQFLVEVEGYAVGLAALETYAHELANRKRGSLRIIAMPALAMGFLPHFLARFLDDRDLSLVHIHGTPSHLVIDAMATGQADLGFAAAPRERPGLVIEPLEARVVVAMPRRHRLAKRDVVRVGDLRNERIVALSGPTVFASPLPHDLSELINAATISTPLSGIACSLVAAGAGIALIDPFAVAGAADPRLTAVPFEPSIPIRISIVTVAGRPQSNLTLDFIAALKAFIPTVLEGRMFVRRSSQRA